MPGRRSAGERTGLSWVWDDHRVGGRGRWPAIEQTRTGYCGDRDRQGRYWRHGRGATLGQAPHPGRHGDAFTKAVFLDFLHSKGETNFSVSTMRVKANKGDLEGACRENTR